KIERARRALEALQAAMIDEVATSQSHLDDGHRSVKSWVMAVTNCSSHDARTRVEIAATVHDLPDFGDALYAGSLGVSQALEVVRLHSNPRSREHLAGSLALLLEHANGLSFRQFRVVTARWQSLADPDGAHHDHERAHTNRHVSSSVVGAGFELRAHGDGLCGEIINDIIAQFADAEFAADWATARETHGDRTTACHLTRTSRQRRFDALMAILRAAAGAGTTAKPGPVVVTVDILTDQQTFEHHLRRASGQQPPPLDPATFVDRHCETIAGTVIDPRDMLTAALIGRVRRVITDTSDLVIDLGRRQRFFVGAVREAVLLSGDRCLWPGCDVRSGQIHIDHTTPWASSQGRTNVTNGGPLCALHNRLKETGFTIVRDNTPLANWHIFRLDGTEIAARRR
ncbi:MAG: DUF222 domain-containing protein, partial [Ilumatobacteraceae bacterium]